MREGSLDAYQLAARTLRDPTKDKAYRAYPMGQEAGYFLRWKRGRLTAESYRDCEATLDKLARHFPDLEISDFEPPVGTTRLEEFMDYQWGERAPRTYNKNLSNLKEFFKFVVLKGKLHGDPTLGMERHKARAVHREIFNDADVDTILAHGPDPENPYRDRVCLRLILRYALRKGAVRSIQLRSFDHTRKRLTFRTKGGKVQTIPIPEPAFWNDLERFIQDTEGKPEHYLLCRQKSIPRGFDKTVMHQYRDKPMGEHGAHNWWYRCLARAGVVGEGVTSGERMHKGRHTSGQRVLDKTKGNLKAVQALLGHADIGTTANIYTDWDIDRLEETMREVAGE